MVDVLHHVGVNRDDRSLARLDLLLLHREQQVVEGLARPDLGEGRVIAGAAQVLDALPFARYCIDCQRLVEEEERMTAG